MRRLAAFAAALLVAAASALPGVVTPVSAAPVSQCTSSTGTIIAVDFSYWGGPVVRGCGTHSATGYQLLHDGGFTTAGDQHDGPAFICRIGTAAFGGGTQYPTATTEACILTPPASAYWSYWVAEKGATTWTYSSRGAFSDDPQAGAVELWRFGGTNLAGTKGQPTISPDALRARDAPPAAGGGSGGTGGSRTGSGGSRVRTSSHASTATATAHERITARGGSRVRADSKAAVARQHSAPVRPGCRPTSPNPPSSSSAAARARSSASRTGCRHTSPSSPRPNSSSVRSRVDAAAAASRGSSAPSVVNAKAASESAQASRGSAAPVILALALLLVLVVGAGWTVVRRRRGDSAGA